MQNASSQPTQAQVLFRAAYDYEQIGDVYNAVKLYRKTIRVSPNFAPSYYQLCKIYKSRKEWKPTLHYGLKTLELTQQYNDKVWNLVALAAVALNRHQVLRRALPHVSPISKRNTSILPIRINTPYWQEVVWAKPIHPLKAQIVSIPHPDSGRKFGEIVLYDYKANGYRVVETTQYPIHDELQLLKRSFYTTYSLLIPKESSDKLDKLEELCSAENMGFEIWSNLNLHRKLPSKRREEYYDHALGSEAKEEFLLIALAARSPKLLLQTLKTWRIITLVDYFNLEAHP